MIFKRNKPKPWSWRNPDNDFKLRAYATSNYRPGLALVRDSEFKELWTGKVQYENETQAQIAAEDHLGKVLDSVPESEVRFHL